METVPTGEPSPTKYIKKYDERLRSKCAEEESRRSRLPEYERVSCVDCGSEYWKPKRGRIGRCCVCRKLASREACRRHAGWTGSQPLPGFPKTEKFRTMDEIADYLSGEKVQCLLCGREYRSLNQHIIRTHDVMMADYKEHFGIPVGRGVVGRETSELLSENAHAIIERRVDELGEEGLLQWMNRARDSRSEDCWFDQRRLVPAVKEERKKATQKMWDSPRHISKLKKRVDAPCSACGKTVNVSEMTAITHQCYLLCKECRRKRARECERKWKMRNVGKMKEYQRAHDQYYKRGNIQPMIEYMRKYPNGMVAKHFREGKFRLITRM